MADDAGQLFAFGLLSAGDGAAEVRSSKDSLPSHAAAGGGLAASRSGSGVSAGRAPAWAAPAACRSVAACPLRQHHRAFCYLVVLLLAFPLMQAALRPMWSGHACEVLMSHSAHGITHVPAATSRSQRNSLPTAPAPRCWPCPATKLQPDTHWRAGQESVRLCLQRRDHKEPIGRLHQCCELWVACHDGYSSSHVAFGCNVGTARQQLPIIIAAVLRQRQRRLIRLASLLDAQMRRPALQLLRAIIIRHVSGLPSAPPRGTPSPHGHSC